LPLSNVVLCSTSLPQDVRVGPTLSTKPNADAHLLLEQIRLADTAQQMGATHKLDLTGEVTHLIVGDLDTPKYKYVAKERPDIVVLDPAWIDAVREVWMDGGDVDVEGLEKAHRYPTFAGLKICITGIPDQARRNQLSSTIEHGGAEYHGDLTKQVTHLLVAAPEGAKYKAAKDWRIHTVSLKWLEDSVQRGMALDPRYYDPTMSDEEQGKGAYRKEAGSRTTLGKRLRAEERPSSVANENGKRKLRRHASRRLEDHSQDMWQDISAADVSTTVTAPPETDQWTAGEEDSQLNLGRPGPRPQVRKSFDAREVRTAEEVDSRPQGLFSGWRITMQGFAKDKAERLTQYLDGAHVVQRLQDLETTEGDDHPWKYCLLVPHSQPTPDTYIDPAPPGVITATEWWVERCILRKQVLDPEVDALSQPLWNLNIIGFSKLTVSTTGFSGADYRQVAEAVKLSGATYQELLNSSISVLISGSATVKKEKAYYAAKHQIPVVTADWLWTCLKTKRKTSTERYRIELPKFDPNDIGRTSMASPALSDTLARSNSTNTKTAKDNQTLSRLSNTRKRQTTPSLPLQARKTSPKPKAPLPAGPFVHEDEDEDDEDPGYHVGGDDNTSADPVPGKAVPLQDISTNSPRKPSSAEPIAAKISTERHPSLDGSLDVEEPVEKNPARIDTDRNEAPSHAENETLAPLPTPQPPVRPQAEWTADLASLMEKQQRRPSSEHTNNPAQRLKHRKLGRAISGSSLSNRANDVSTSAQLLHQDTTASKDTSFSESPEDDPASREADLPSTQIGYETLETEAARRQMAKRMGMDYSDESVGTRLASLGTVRDSAGSGGANGGGRSRTRPRN